jgi:hypothetical protein
MRHHVLLCLSLTLSGCTGIENWRETAVFGREPQVAAADSPILRRLMGQEVLDQPLLPQPGNIWADVLPAPQPDPPAAAPASFHGVHRPVAATLPSAGVPRPALPAIAAADPGAASPVAAAVAAAVPVAAAASPMAATSPAGLVSPAATVRVAAALSPTAPPSRAGHLSPEGVVSMTAAIAPTAAASRTGPVSPAGPVSLATAVSPGAAVASAGEAVPSAGSAIAMAVPRVVVHPEVQLAAAQSAQSAEAEWRRLRRDAPTLTEGRLPVVREAEVNGQHVWRLRAAGFADVAEASAFCIGMRAAKSECWVVPASASP